MTMACRSTEVGPWAKDKHARLRKYVDITRATRRKFVRGTGGASYVDLYCGFGRATIRETGEKIDGSPLVAFKSAAHGKVPFSQFFVADASEEKAHAAGTRIVNAGGSPIVQVGPADETARRIVRQLNPHGLHFAFLDPYKLEDLPFSVIEAFSQLQHIDLLIHVSAQDLQRNLDLYSKAEDGPLDTFAPGWRNTVDQKQSQPATRASYVSYWASKIQNLGLAAAEHAELVTGSSRNQRLYWLVLVSRHALAREFWDKIRNVSGQGELSL